jgi:hypothetical protein
VTCALVHGTATVSLIWATAEVCTPSRRRIYGYRDPSLLTGSKVMMTCSLQGRRICSPAPSRRSRSKIQWSETVGSPAEKSKREVSKACLVSQKPHTSFLALAPRGQHPCRCLRFQSSSAAFRSIRRRPAVCADTCVKKQRKKGSLGMPAILCRTASLLCLTRVVPFIKE